MDIMSAEWQTEIAGALMLNDFSKITSDFFLDSVNTAWPSK